ncbi:MarR family winged helix-turn-helix transcriptional regulator [Sphingobium sp.]|uniref:MarR family winged helix-turn-helix transcriptional regulator n=1 Tax=Sphingobium sp. TaxID=1912891 RepID=UPI0028BE8ED9|nr:MarR family winged helix-turn-helix transcriptional regulator [Sphingobium sp.]
MTSEILHDPIASRLGYLLRRASSAMMADLGRALGEIALRPVEGTILILIGANPDCTQSDLGRMLGIGRTNMVPLISALSKRGYLDKSPVDGRSFALTLTKSGEEARRQVDKIMDAHEERFARLIVGQDVAGLRTALALIAAQPEDVPPS